MMEAEFPVGRLLNGDSYKPVTRMKNISSAMTWVQKQLQGFRESDENLSTLFKTLEKEVADLKSIYSDGGRARIPSISSINGLLKPQPSQSSIQSYQDVYSHTGHSVVIVEEAMTIGSAANLTHSDSNSSSTNSLAEYANELGLGDDDDDEEEVLPSESIFARSSLKSQTSSASNVSDETSYRLTVQKQNDRTAHDNLSINSRTSYNNSNFVRAYAGTSSAHSSYRRHQKEDDTSNLDNTSIYSSRTNANDSPPVSRTTLANTTGSHHSSNDSGNIADLDSFTQFTPKSRPATNSLENTLTSDTCSLKPSPSGNSDDKRLSGFADEIFAMFNISK